MSEKEFSPDQERLCLGKYRIDDEGYVDFGAIASGELHQQSQYASRYVSGLDRPKLSDSLRFLGHPNEYHELRIHADDVEEFVRRVREHQGE